MDLLLLFEALRYRSNAMKGPNANKEWFATVPLINCKSQTNYCKASQFQILEQLQLLIPVFCYYKILGVGQRYKCYLGAGKGGVGRWLDFRQKDAECLLRLFSGLMSANHHRSQESPG